MVYESTSRTLGYFVPRTANVMPQHLLRKVCFALAICPPSVCLPCTKTKQAVGKPSQALL